MRFKMAVLVEAISVVIRADRLDPFGTWEAFTAIVPNETLCADNELVRVGFTSPLEARAFVDVLRSHGLRFSETGPAEDIVICDQQRGFTTECPWAEFGSIDYDRDPNRPTACARLKGSTVRQIVTPIGWTWERSLTREFLFLPTEAQRRETGSSGVREGGAGIREIETLSPEERDRFTPGFLRGRDKKRSLWDRLRGRH